MTGRAKNRPALSAAEWHVMKVVWEFGPLAARDLYAHLTDSQSWGYATVKTLLRRLVKKGWLDFEQVGNSYLYRAAVRRDKAVGAAIGEFSGRVLDGVLAPFVAYLAKQDQLTGDDLDQLEQIIQQQRRREQADDT